MAGLLHEVVNEIVSQLSESPGEDDSVGEELESVAIRAIDPRDQLFEIW